MSDYPQLLWERDLVVVRQPITNNQEVTCEGCTFLTGTGDCDRRGYRTVSCVRGACDCILIKLEARD